MFRKSVACALIVASGLLPMASQAGMIGTDQAIAVSRGTSDLAGVRAKVESFLVRNDVAQKLNVMGVSSDAAKERVNALTPEELQLVAAKIDSMPAGGYITETGGVIIGVTLIVIIALLAYAPQRK